MQENRAYDHYYGMLNGVRGFNDRSQTVLPSGLPSLFQPSDQTKPTTDYILPFGAWTLNTSSICMGAPTMEYFVDIAMVNGGRYDAWNTARAPGMGMSYMTRADLPFYYALYDAFTAGDEYHQSTFTCTNPNRMHLFTGSNGLSVGQPAVIDNTEPAAGYDWETMGETLEKAGISWKVYQQADNFDDNGFAWFANFKNAKPGNPLYDKGMARVDDLIEAFDADIKAGTLPQVSWIVGPANVSEHATWWPSAGEDFTARLLKVVSDPTNAATYAKMAFILDYDEGGQFFDHRITPMPVLKSGDGLSTVTSVGEVSVLGLPVGLGFRVPFLAISPWSRGHKVVSQTFDHTSVIQFVEKRFGVHCPNISPWRRTIAGDLTAAFDFNSYDTSWPSLPDTSDYVPTAASECAHMPSPHIPAVQTYPQQEEGTRISMALPYEWVVSDAIVGSTLSVTINNTGQAGAAFSLADVINMKTVNPRQWAIASGTSGTDTVPIVGTTYFFSLSGPNGFVRIFSGDVSAPGATAARTWMTYSPSSSPPTVDIHISIDSSAPNACIYNVSDAVYGMTGVTGSLAAGQDKIISFDMTTVGQWYDWKVQLSFDTQNTAVSRRFAGRMETGVNTISDPAMSAGLPGWAIDYASAAGLLPKDVTTVADLALMTHPDLPLKFQFPEKIESSIEDKDGRWEFKIVPT